MDRKAKGNQAERRELDSRDPHLNVHSSYAEYFKSIYIYEYMYMYTYMYMYKFILFISL